jgi:hypothetical protein
MSPTGAMRVSALLPFDWLGGRALVNSSPRCNASMVPLPAPRRRWSAFMRWSHPVSGPSIGSRAPRIPCVASHRRDEW